MADVREIVARAVWRDKEPWTRGEPPSFDPDGSTVCASDAERAECYARANTILSALSSAGFAVVPREATVEMCVIWNESDYHEAARDRRKR